jgi:hypothetical protein
MTKVIGSMIAGALLLTGAGVSRAQTDEMRQQMKKEVEGKSDKPVESLRMVKATVKQVNPSAHTMTVDIEVSPEADFTSDSGKPLKIDQVKPGDTVTAAVDPDTGKVVHARVSPVSRPR